MSEVKTRLQCSVVVVSGQFFDGFMVEQEFPIQHDASVESGKLMGQALSIVRGTGGLVTKNEKDGLFFYPIEGFKRLEVTVKRVVLSSASRC